MVRGSWYVVLQVRGSLKGVHTFSSPSHGIPAEATVYTTPHLLFPPSHYPTPPPALHLPTTHTHTLTDAYGAVVGKSSYLAMRR